MRGADRRHGSTRAADRASNAALEVHRIGHHAVKGTAGLSRGIVKKNAHGKSRDGHEIEFGKRQIHAGLFNAIPQCVGVLGASSVSCVKNASGLGMLRHGSPEGILSSATARIAAKTRKNSSRGT